MSVSKETLEATAGEVLDLLFQVIDFDRFSCPDYIICSPVHIHDVRVGFWSLAGWVLKECGVYRDTIIQVLEAEGESPDGANLNRAEKVGMLFVTSFLSC